MDINEVINTKFEGVEIPETVKEKLTGVLTEYEKAIEKANSDLEFQKNESKKAFEKRDEVKNEFRSYKSQVIAGQAPEVQDLSKKVLDYEMKFEGLEKSIEDYKTLLENANKVKTDIETKQREDLLKSLPEGSESRKFAEGLNDLDKLRSFVEVAKKEKIGVDGGKPGGNGKLDPNKTYDDYTSRELDEMKKEHPEAYEQLRKKKYPRV